MPQIRADEHPKVNLVRWAGTAAAVPFLSLPYLGKLMCERGQRYGNEEEKEGGNRKQLVLVRAQSLLSQSVCVWHEDEAAMRLTRG